MQLKGRHWLMLWLLLFLVRAAGDRHAADAPASARLAGLGELREERTTLEARRAELERQIRVASSRQVLVPVAERRLGLHEPSDSEFTSSCCSRRCPTASPDGQARGTNRRHPGRASRSACSPCWRERSSSRSWRASDWAKKPRRAAGPSGGVLPARRGALYDRNGVPLAVTQEFYHVGIAPNELDDRGRRVPPASSRSLGVSARSARPGVPGREALDLSARPLQRDPGPAAALAGRACTSRAASSDSILRASSRAPIIGGLPPDRAAGGGRSRAGPRLHSHRATRARRCSSRTARAVATTRRPARSATRCRATTWCSRSTPSCRRSPSGDWTDALEEMQAEGGDVVFLDPRTGELLALASRQAVPGAVPRASTFTDPVRAGLHGEALHRGGAAHARSGRQHRDGVRRRAVAG